MQHDLSVSTTATNVLTMQKDDMQPQKCWDQWPGAILVSSIASGGRTFAVLTVMLLIAMIDCSGWDSHSYTSTCWKLSNWGEDMDAGTLILDAHLCQNRCVRYQPIPRQYGCCIHIISLSEIACVALTWEIKVPSLASAAWIVDILWP